MALVGIRYIQDNDPGTPPSGGYEWFRPSTNELFVRNGSNTAWVIQGNAAESRLGNMALSGGEAKGAISGDVGLVPLNNPNIQTSATQAGKTIATVEDIKAVMESIRMDFEQIASGAINGATGGQSLVGKFVMGEGEVDSGVMSAPWFSIVGASPTPGLESWSAWIAGPTLVAFSDATSGGGAGAMYVKDTVTSTLRANVVAYSDPGFIKGKFRYFKVGVYV